MDPRSLTKDFKEFLQCLNVHGVEYLVIGGHAVAFHGYPRATADLDVWVAVKQENALRLVAALKEFGFDVPELTPELFLSRDRIIRMGNQPLINERTRLLGLRHFRLNKRPIVTVTHEADLLTLL